MRDCYITEAAFFCIKMCGDEKAFFSVYSIENVVADIDLTW